MTKNILFITSSKNHYEFCNEIYKSFIDNEDHETIINKLNNIENTTFKDYDTWTWIEPLIMLKCRLSQDDNLKKACRKKICQALNTGEKLQVEIKKKIFQRVLKGEELSINKLEENINEKTTFESCINTIMELVTIIEMGASENFTIKEAEELLQKIMLQARKFMQHGRLR